MTQFIDVAAAAIINAQNDVLIAKRAAHRHQGDRWEFPGGKLELGERAEQALVRELQEELGITATQYRPLITIRHHYGDKAVRLHVFRVNAFSGEPHGHEGQPLAWVPAERLVDYEFPAANVPIVSAVQLPERLLITPELNTTPEEFVARITRACQRGIRLIQLRAHALSDAAYRELALAVHAITSAYQSNLILNRNPASVADLPCEGWHLTSHQARSLLSAALVKRPRWLSVSCHDLTELQQAKLLGADFVLLSPVLATASHPDVSALGWSRFADLAAQANCPVYALGGVSERDLETSWHHGGQGIAAIRALWPE